MLLIVPDGMCLQKDYQLITVKNTWFYLGTARGQSMITPAERPF